MRTLKQPMARLLARGILVAAVSACSVAAWAQSGSQGGSTPPGKSNVAPPPADLEPGVNTSATQLSSPEPAPTPAVVSPPKPALKRAQTSAKSAASANPSGAPSSTSAGSTGAESAAGSSVAAGAAASGSAKGASTGAAPASVATAAGRASKPGAPGGKAHDSIELDTTQITGNRELPKVLYIVPWKRSDLGDLVGKPVNSILDEVLTPVDRDVFKRQNRYYDALKPDDAKDAAGAATGANEKH